MCMSPKLVNVKKTFITENIFDFKWKNKSVDHGEVYLPCGKCADCKVSHSKSWALRSMLELSTMEKKDRLNCWFLTLTYNDKNLPIDGKLKMDHVSLFIKKIRHFFEKRKIKRKIKYFVCGEYGEKQYRPHYHMLIYGLPLNDLKIYKKVGMFDYLFLSSFLDKMWGRGYVVAGSLNFKTAFYTCRYTLKKVGSTCDVKMRCSHGFGKQFCLDNVKKIVDNCCVRFNGFNWSIPKYFLKIIRKNYFKYLSEKEKIKIGSFWDRVNWRNGINYVSWLKYRKKLLNDQMNKKSELLNTNELFFNNDFMSKNDFVVRKNIGNSLTVNVDQENKKIINQSLFGVYKKRGNFVL